MLCPVKRKVTLIVLFCLSLSELSGFGKAQSGDVTMPKPKPSRYFVNNLPLYKGAEVEVDPAVKETALRMAHQCLQKSGFSLRELDGGLYVGTPGIAYMFYHLSQNPTFADQRKELLEAALDTIQKIEAVNCKSSYHDLTDSCSFILGKAGMNAVSAAIYQATGHTDEANDRIERYKEAAKTCTPVDFVNFGGDELFVGRAGYLCGAIWLNSVFNKEVIPRELLLPVCNSIIESGSRMGTKKNPLVYSYYDTDYFGAAHGSSSILQMLLSYEPFLQTSPSRSKVMEAVDSLLSLQAEDGNFPCAADSIGQKADLVHWCHGAPGIVYLMARAFLVTHDQKYLRSAIKCGDVTWEKGLLRKGPGICHGVSGSGYVFLLLYRLTGDKSYLHKANQFAHFLNMPEFREARIPDHPYSLYEGTSGTVCFLADLLSPESAQFPFFNVFLSSSQN